MLESNLPFLRFFLEENLCYHISGSETCLLNIAWCYHCCGPSPPFKEVKSKRVTKPTLTKVRSTVLGQHAEAQAKMAFCSWESPENTQSNTALLHHNSHFLLPVIKSPALLSLQIGRICTKRIFTCELWCHSSTFKKITLFFLSSSFLAIPWSMLGLSSPTRDRTCLPCIGKMEF